MATETAQRRQVVYTGRRTLAPYVFLAPGFALFLTWMVYPLAKAFQMSLHRWNPLPGAHNPFVGVANYARAFADPVFWLAMQNTVVYTVVTVVGQMALGLAVALMIDRIAKGQVFFRAVYYLPVITSWVVVSILFKYLFNSSPSGLINYLFKDVLHLMPGYVAWLSEARSAWVAIWSLGIWKGVGWTMLIYLAALQGVPRELYEAAAIDGASRGQLLRRITLPLIRSTTLFILVMLIIGGFNAFISVYLITGGGPMQRTEVLLSYMYNQGFKYLDFGYATALSYLLAALIFAISYAQMRLFSRPVEY